MVFITPILKSLVVPVIWLALIDAIYSRIAPFFCFKSHLFPSQWEGHNKNNTTNQISRLFKENNQIAGKWKKKSIVANFATFISKTVIPPPPNKWMNQISNRLSTASIKYLNWPSPVFEQFQNGCNVLVISNRTSAAPKLHFTQFNYHYKPV